MALQVWLPLNGNLNNQGLSNLTFSGSPTFESGKLGQSARFGSNSNRAISTTKVTLGTQVTISFWIKIVSWVGWGRVYNLYDTTTNTSFNACIWQTAGSIGTQLYSNGTKIHDSYAGDLSDFKWHHFTVVVDNSSKKHYLDGNLVGSWTTDSGGSMPSSMEYTVMVGGNRDDGSPSDMNINDFRVYNHALSGKEVREISRCMITHYALNTIGTINNHFKNSNFYLGNTSNWYGVNSSRISVINIGGKKVITGTRGDHGFIYGTTVGDYTYTANTYLTYTISADIYTEIETTVDVANWISTTQASGWQSMTYNKTWHTSNQLKIGWNHICVTFTNSRHPYYDGWIVTAFWFSEDNISMTNVKFEFNDTETPWCPNFEDLIYSELGYDSNIEYDSSGYSNNGSKNGTIDLDSDSPKYITSSIFNGTDAYITAPSVILDMSKITFSVWCKCKSYTNRYTRLFDFATATQGAGYNFYASHIETTKTLIIGYRGPGMTQLKVYEVTDLDLNTWYHLAFIITGLSCAVYVNGTLVETITLDGEEFTEPVQFIYNYLGKSNYSADKLYDGNLSDFRIYATALSGEDVKELYQTSAIIDNKGSIYCYEFVET